MSRITEFKNEHRFLSNFWFVDVVLEGKVYSTTEHAYQAAKTTSASEREKIRWMDKPGEVKKISRHIKLREDWEEIKLLIMEDLNSQKFSKEPLKSKLLATGNKELIEGNWWHDNFWGSCFCDKCRFQGRNELGKILMKIRGKIK